MRGPEWRRVPDLEGLVGSIEEILFEFDREGTYVGIWTGDESKLFLPRDRLLGRSVSEVFGHEVGREVEALIRRVLDTGAPESVEYPLKVHGEERWFAGTVTPVRRGEGHMSTVCLVTRDVTDEQARRRTADETEEGLRLALRASGTGVWEFDINRGRAQWDEQMEAIFGLAPGEFGGSLDEALSRIHPDDRDEALRGIERTVTEGAPATSRHRIVRPDGSVRWIQSWGGVVRWEHGRPAMLMGLVADVTKDHDAQRHLLEALEKERQATANLQVLDEMKNGFLNAVSHELRTPLAAVLGSALTLDRLGLDLGRADQQAMLQAIVSNSKRLDRLLSDLLDLDRLTRGVVHPRLVATELGQLIHGMVATAGLEGRQVHVDAPAMVLPVDPAKVERIVENLLVNAAKYTPPGTPVWVSLRRVPEGAILSVEDVGPGVPDQLKRAVFEPFRQASARSHAPGVGIGLSLVARFAALHGGEAWVEDRPGGGAAFRVLLRDPVAPRPSER
jgi:PAS domain S-box-containing protein